MQRLSLEKALCVVLPVLHAHKVDLESLFPDILSQLGENIIRASLNVVDDLAREDCACFFHTLTSVIKQNPHYLRSTRVMKSLNPGTAHFLRSI